MFLARLAERRILPVVVLPGEAQAVDLARTLLAEGLDVIEITCRTPAALAGIRAIRAACPEMLVAAGTVLSADQARATIAAGAQCLLSPGFDPAVVVAARDLDVPVIPGVATPSEILAARNHGLDFLKLFPAGQLGGAAYLRTLASVFSAVRFLPTGGITEASLAEYLAEPNVACCGGSWLVPERLIDQGRWDDIRARVRAARATAGAVRESRPSGAA